MKNLLLISISILCFFIKSKGQTTFDIVRLNKVKTILAAHKDSTYACFTLKLIDKVGFNNQVNFEFYKDSIRIFFCEAETSEFASYMGTHIVLNPQGEVQKIQRFTSGNAFYWSDETWKKDGYAERTESRPKTTSNTITKTKRGISEKETLAIAKANAMISIVVDGTIPELDLLSQEIIKQYCKVFKGMFLSKFGTWQAFRPNFKDNFQHLCFIKDGSSTFISIDLTSKKTEVKNAKSREVVAIEDQKLNALLTDLLTSLQKFKGTMTSGK